MDLGSEDFIAQGQDEEQKEAVLRGEFGGEEMKANHLKKSRLQPHVFWLFNDHFGPEAYPFILYREHEPFHFFSE